MKRLRSGAAGAALLGCLSVVLVAPPARAESVSERLKQTRADLEGSSAALQAAGVALARTANLLVGARREAASARGQLAGAQAVLAQAERTVHAGEVALTSAERRVTAASAALDASREQLGRLASRSYQLGPYQEVRTLVDSGPGEFLERTSMLQQAFKGGDDALHHLTVDRLALASERADLQRAQQALDAARDQAASRQRAAQAVALRAQQALDRVESLVAERRAAQQVAADHRAEDLRDYRAAQAASAELARRLREAAREAARNANAPKAAVGRMLWPADGPMTSRYGWRDHPIYQERRFHAGIDIGAGYGAPVLSSESGTVVYAGAANGYGTLVLISHGTKNGKDLATAYAHMSALLVTQGQKVSRGQQVGRVGSEGNSTGPHLHFEVRLDGNPVDPLDYVSPP